ncbi:MAG: ABC1 kinase family protein [Acidimicrobiales bacterium]
MPKVTELHIEPIRLPVPSRAEVARRLGTCAGALGRHLVAARRRGRLDEAAVAAVIRRTFEDLGGTFSKFGQLIASSPGIFGDEVAHKFRGFLDTGPPVPFVAVCTVIESDLGRPLADLYREFEPEPMAAASLAVVHRAVLPDGRAVAVKVLRPGIEHALATDLAVLAPVCRVVARQVAVGIAGTLPGLVTGLATQLAEEVDLANEARAIRWFAGVLDTIGATRMLVPELDDERCGHRVLTMELVDGVPVDDDAGIAALGVDPAPLVHECLRAWFAATVCTGAFHGDIHAGNLLVCPDGRMAVLDWGIVGRLDADTARFFRRLIEAAVGDDTGWFDVAQHLEAQYGSGVREALGLDDGDFVAFVRSQVEPLLCLPFGQVDLRTMLIGNGAADGAPVVRTRRQAARSWWAERRRQRALMELDGYGGGFDQATFLLSKQLVYFDRYGKRYLADLPLLDDPDAYRSLLASTAVDPMTAAATFLS